jgi:hypothetical protein
VSAKYLCLNCWRALEREDAYYRCDACGEGAERPGWMQRSAGARRRLRDVRRPLWSRLFADDGARRPPCAKHPDAPYQLFCECGYPLSERAALRRATAVGLGVAGPRSSGKTLLVITMMHELHRLELGGRKLGAVGLDDTEARFDELSAGFFERGDKPHATPLVGPEPARWDERAALAPGNLGWTLSVDNGGGRRAAPPVLLAVNDLGGETWGLPSHERRDRFDRYLGHLGSLMFLLDGGAMAADLGYDVDDAWDQAPPRADRGATSRQWFSRIAERLGRRTRRVDLALVVSKADSLWHREPWEGLKPADDPPPENGERQELLEHLLLEARHRDVLIEARQSFRNVRLFAASSLGFLPGSGDVDSAGLLKRTADPYGVTEPFVWLLRHRLPALL